MQTCHGLARFLSSPGECAARRGEGWHEHETRILAHRHLCPRAGLGIATSKEMGAGSGALHAEDLTIMWAEAHGARFALDRSLRFAEPDLHPAAHGPGHGEVWIEHESPLNHCVPVVEVTDDIGESSSCRPERDRVVLPELSSPYCQAAGFGDVMCTVVCPAYRLALDIASRRHAISRRKARVELNRLVEVRECLVVALPGPSMIGGRAAEVAIVSVEALRRFAPGPLNLGLLQFRSDGPHHARGHL